MANFWEHIASNSQVVGPDFFASSQKLLKQGNFYVAGPAAPPLVLRAESDLKVTFPDEFRTFLLQFGALIGPGVEIYGIAPDTGAGPPFFQNITTETTQLRRAKQIDEGKPLLPISDDGMGITFMLNCADRKQREVLAYGLDVDEVVVGNDLAEFIQNMQRDSCSSILNQQ